MKRKYPPLWLCSLILLLVLIWRMVGAPLTAEGFQDLRTPFRQARILAPSRIRRILCLWLPWQTGVDGTPVQEGQKDEALKLAAQKEGVVLTVYLEEEDRTVSMPLENYVCGVVAAEMPAAYHLQALAAQAVAARTLALCQQKNKGCAAHAEADICTDSGCCQAYASQEKCRAKWGNEYDAYWGRVVQAVSATADELLTYEGEPITVLYHAISGGQTENVQAVFAQSLPYLVSVESKGEEGVRGFSEDTYYSFAETAQRLNRSLPDLQATADQIRRTLTIGSHTAAGRVDTVLVGERNISAKDVRKALGLRSTWFSLTTDEEGVTFHQRGYGHGVGMSQAGANSMAANGADYADILAHYYPGTTLSKR